MHSRSASFLQPGKFARGGDRGVLAAHFNFDKSRAALFFPGFDHRRRRGAHFVAVNQRQMIVLDYDAVSQAQPVRAASTHMQRALIQQAPGSLPRAGNARRRTTLRRAFLHALRRGGNAAHALQQIQAHPLQRQNLALRSLDTHQRVTGIQNVAVLFLQHHFQPVLAKQPRIFFQPGRHSRFARNNLRRRRLIFYAQRRHGRVPRQRIGFQQRAQNRAHRAQIIFIGEGQFGAAEQRLLDDPAT